MVTTLRVVSYLAPNWFDFYQTVVSYLGRTLQVNCEFIQSPCDPLVDPTLLKDHCDLVFICGLPLIRYTQLIPQKLQPIVAPVMRSNHYQNRPIYFSNVIVNSHSSYQKLQDLMGKTVCYNDPGSNSGYFLLCSRLMQEPIQPFFQHAIQSGSHQTSIRWVIEGRADCAAIDSTVLERELQLHATLALQLQLIESIGPAPMPPLAVTSSLDPTLVKAVQSALLQPDATLQAAMQSVRVERYAPVTLKDYQPIATCYEAVLNSGYRL
ncbi:MAG: PhnD/SsuA/transferrin family substrate-binding protein [Leptolyngbyaceae cyanobacterium bins.59]|nr:PhnD/SsuA/transferrin family substrate-binding protein [Leptolyngbyaceae cyanobacterium bins.59]